MITERHLRPVLSVIVLNYNGIRWIDSCLKSLSAQTLLPQIEIIVADNVSTDGSAAEAANILAAWPNGRFLQHQTNLGYCGGNNEAAKIATGEFLLFLNNDTWLEPDCLEALIREASLTGAAVAGPLVMDYEDNSFQSSGAFGFDIFGFATSRREISCTSEVLMPEGCAYLIRADLFQELGGFDSEFFMYSDELDLSWRVWISGHKAISVPSARLHHRGAAQVNPAGGGSVVEFRTSDNKRFYANRNSLLVLLINAQHVLLFSALLQIMLLVIEAAASLVIVRRWGHIKRSYWAALRDCWRLRHYILERRRQLRQFRKIGDIGMFRFLRFRLNRWDEAKRMLSLGLPKISSR